MTVPSPAFDLLRPRLPSRRARVAATLAAALLAVALLDLVAVLAWSGLAIHNERLEGVIAAYQQREALANARAAREGQAAREAARARERLEFLQQLPPAAGRSETLLGAVSRALPRGALLTGATLGTDGRLILTGTARVHDDVEAYVRGLKATGEFAYLRVVSVTASEGDPAGVEFQLEGWPRGGERP
ncbi:MAG TPA: PilN domain-containing protein [Thermaerobacter sp.]